MKKILIILWAISLNIQVTAQWSNTSNNSTTGNLTIGQNLWVNNGATISSDFADSDPNSSWNNNLMVRNNNNSINTFSRLSFVSQSGGYGAISLLKTGDYTGDMYFQVRNGAGFYNTPMLIKANGNIGIGTPNPSSKLEVFGKTTTGLRQNGTSSDFEAISVFNTSASNLPSGNGAVIQFYNNSNNYNGIYGASIKSVSVNNQYGWESDLILRTTKNNSYSTQTIMDALTIKGGSGNVGIGTSDPGSFKLAVNGKTWTTEVQVAVSRPPDYVFEPTYQLSPLDSIKTYIDKNKHLPEVPSAKEMEKNGVNLGEMNMLLLKKIEELTLYVIELRKENENQNKQNIFLQKQIDNLTNKIK